MMLKLLLSCLVLLLLLSHSYSYSAKYDLYFKKWGEYYFAWEDWRWFKAQGIAESGLNERAVSWAGAMGIMQLMPLTAREMGVKNVWDPEENIQGGIKYDRWLWDRWGMIALRDERRRFMFASYNAGIGNIRRARLLANSDRWEDVKAVLHRITGRHAEETRGYVARIERIYRRLINAS